MRNSRSHHGTPSPAITYERFNNIADVDDNDHDDDPRHNDDIDLEENNDRYGLAGISPCNSDKRALPRRADSTDSEDGPGTSSPPPHHEQQHHHYHQTQSLRHNNSRTRSPTSVSSSPDHRYEEFSSKLTLTCPTCKGKGKLTQGWFDICYFHFVIYFLQNFIFIM